MIIPTSPLLRSEDYDKTVQGWIARLLSPLNGFISSVTQAINGKLTFSDNFAGLQKALSFTFASNTLPMTFATAFGTPSALEVVAATENGNPTIIKAAWSYSSGALKITDLVKLSSTTGVSALTAGASYKITVRTSV